MYGNKNVHEGNFLTPYETRKAPRVSFTFHPLSHESYVLSLVDPDAVGGTKVHWLIKDIPNTNTIVVPYVGPRPPPGSGVHRYIFSVWKQKSLQLVHQTFFTSEG